MTSTATSTASTRTRTRTSAKSRNDPKVSGRQPSEQAVDAAIDSASRLLRLPTMRDRYAEIADAAGREQLSYRAFLAELLLAECDDRTARRAMRRVHEAGFPRPKTLADFNFNANTAINPATINTLAGCGWISARSPGYEAVRPRRGHRADQRSPQDRRELHFHGPGQGRDPRDRHRDLYDRDPPARGAEDHHRGALQRNGRRVLLLRHLVRQRWGPALHLVGGRRALPPGLELPRRENTISGTPTTAGAFTITVRVTDDMAAFSEHKLSITIS